MRGLLVHKVCTFLEPEVCEGSVGLGHAVRVVALELHQKLTNRNTASRDTAR